jgi:hypothetical protein
MNFRHCNYHDLLNSRDAWLSPACSFASFRRSPFGATLPAPKLARNVKCQKDDMLNAIWRRVRNKDY